MVKIVSKKRVKILKKIIPLKAEATNAWTHLKNQLMKKALKLCLDSEFRGMIYFFFLKLRMI